MEYPIIDTLTNAYIRNDWTGLNVIRGKNLMSTNIIRGGVNFETGDVISSPIRIRTNNFISLKSGTYTISYNETNIQMVGYVYVNGVFNEEYSFRNAFVNSPYTFTVPVDFSILLAFRFTTNDNIVPDDLTQLQIESRNLLDSEIIRGGVDYDTGDVINLLTRIRTKSYTQLKQGTYTVSYNETNIQMVGYVYVNGVFNEEYSFRNTFVNSPYTFTVPVDFSILLAFRFTTNDNIVPDDLTNLQIIDINAVPSPYEPYKPPTTDIFSRTRLPIIRYFPHALIDSLQRASDGTMTSDDVQVLRHYLSRFGIGNIEPGRFHAINTNMEENKTVEFEKEEIPIEDFPIEEKKKTGGD